MTLTGIQSVTLLIMGLSSSKQPLLYFVVLKFSHVTNGVVCESPKEELSAILLGHHDDDTQKLSGRLFPTDVRYFQESYPRGSPRFF